MEMQHKFDLELKQMEVDRMVRKEELIEDRKDERSKQEATQQSTLMNQRANDLTPTNFKAPESQNLNGFGLSQFE
jgi:hypothetical protein